MSTRKPVWIALAVAAVIVIAVGAVAWAGTSETAAAARAGIDADTVDGHHAASSKGTAGQRANAVLWAQPNGKLSAKALPMGILDNRYLGRQDDTLLYVPGSELVINFEETNVADILYSHTGIAWVRKTGSAGTVKVVLPMQLPAQQSGDWVKLINARVYYDLDNAADKIDTTWIVKLDASTGGHITLATDGTDRTSATFSSFVVDCGSADCTLSWPTGGFVTVVMDLVFSGTGDPHDIGIAGVLLRYSYD